MDTMRNIVLFCLCLVLVVMVTRSTWGAKETCADLEFHGFRDGETAKVEEKTYLNVIFHVSTTKCTTLPTWLRVKVSYHQANFTLNVCSIIFERQICDISYKSHPCRCVNDCNGAAQLYMEFNMSGNVSYIWSLSDSTSGQMQKKAQIIFDVSSTASTTEPSSTPTDGGVDKPEVTTARVTPPGNEPQNESDIFQVIFFTSVITASVIGVPVVTGIIIYVYRAKKRRKERETSVSQGNGKCNIYIK
ncbi:uncharacterized protein LOC112569051 isoform X2 [Pomacea canaliculata]|uniref:uncharacterized protein LOC112569051 isoform X2 n=1 Tax=Pomacea canaliculata TaxID=400727 RepID=UPI000D733E8A|nr:uncharacterized protein LOC112569051 isoform X2 [Pomacea canaliculata]